MMMLVLSSVAARGCLNWQAGRIHAMHTNSQGEVTLQLQMLNGIWAFPLIGLCENQSRLRERKLLTARPWSRFQHVGWNGYFTTDRSGLRTH